MIRFEFIVGCHCKLSLHLLKLPATKPLHLQAMWMFCIVHFLQLRTKTYMIYSFVFWSGTGKTMPIYLGMYTQTAKTFFVQLDFPFPFVLNVCHVTVLDLCQQAKFCSFQAVNPHQLCMVREESFQGDVTFWSTKIWCGPTGWHFRIFSRGPPVHNTWSNLIYTTYIAILHSLFVAFVSGIQQQAGRLSWWKYSWMGGGSKLFSNRG